MLTSLRYQAMVATALFNGNRCLVHCASLTRLIPTPLRSIYQQLPNEQQKSLLDSLRNVVADASRDGCLATTCGNVAVYPPSPATKPHQALRATPYTKVLTTLIRRPANSINRRRVCNGWPIWQPFTTSQWERLYATRDGEDVNLQLKQTAQNNWLASW